MGLANGSTWERKYGNEVDVVNTHDELYTPSGRNRATNIPSQTIIRSAKKAFETMDFTEAEERMATHIVNQCPKFATRINNLRNTERVSLNTCKFCGEDIIWSSENNFKIPLSPKNGSQHFCQFKVKHNTSPWDEGECPYCGGIDCNCGE